MRTRTQTKKKTAQALERARERKRRVPVRRGDFYCSPACGARCRHSEYLAARRRARALVAQLGDAWRVRVWENMGWFSMATLPGGGMEVHIEVDRQVAGAVQYWLLYNGPSGMHFSTPLEYDARECVRAALKQLCGVADTTNALAIELRDSFVAAGGAV